MASINPIKRFLIFERMKSKVSKLVMNLNSCFGLLVITLDCKRKDWGFNSPHWHMSQKKKKNFFRFHSWSVFFRAIFLFFEDSLPRNTKKKFQSSYWNKLSFFSWNVDNGFFRKRCFIFLRVIYYYTFKIMLL